jgi:hypothetical protein
MDAGALDMGVSQGINQGTVTIRTDGESHMTIYREGVKIGAAPRVLTQRQGTKRWYMVRDEKGALMCADTIAIDEPYQKVDRLCRRGGRHLERPPKPKRWRISPWHRGQVSGSTSKMRRSRSVQGESGC